MWWNGARSILVATAETDPAPRFSADNLETDGSANFFAACGCPTCGKKPGIEIDAPEVVTTTHDVWGDANVGYDAPAADRGPVSLNWIMGTEATMFAPRGGFAQPEWISISGDLDLPIDFGATLQWDDPGPQSLQGPAPPFQANIGGPDIAGNISTSSSLTLGQSFNGSIGVAGDDDWFRVELTAGQSYVFTLNGFSGSGAALSDPFLELYSSTGQLLSINDDSGPGLGSLLRFTAVESGTYYINARAFEDETGPTLTGNYTISFNTGAPQNPLDTINLNFTLTSSNVTYYFAVSGDTYNTGAETQSALRSWTTAEQAAARAAFATYAAVSGLTFTEVSTQSAARFVMMISDLDPGTLGVFYASASGGLGQFEPSGTGWNSQGLQPGGLGFVTLIHEIGHGLGLAHPHDEGGGSERMQGVISPFNSRGTFDLNQGVFTTMTYNDGWDTAPHGASPTQNWGLQATPMALDVALIQQRYGVNSATNAGANEYVLPTATGVGVGYSAIWDGGGVDAIVHNGSAGAFIDLRAATLQNAVGGGGFVSYVTGIHGGFTIAAGAVIENARGGSGADTIRGNDNANQLDGGGGKDTLTGAGGADALIGGAGIDTGVYSVSSSAATFGRTLAGAVTVSTAVDGADTLTGVEVVSFLDRLLATRPSEGSLDGNGTSDILLRSGSGQLAAWSMTGATVSNAAIIGLLDPVYSEGLQGDFNGDGRFDYVARVPGSLLQVVLLNGSAATAAATYAPSASESLVGVGDFNGDGRDDILFRNTSGLMSQWQMDGTAPTIGAFATSDTSWTVASVADFNGDGRDDILWRNSSGLLATWTMDGFSVTSAAVFAVSDPTWAIVGTGDFNGDLREDVLWRSSGGVMALWTMDGVTVTSVGTFAVSDTAWSVSDVGDYNADGRDDILWQGPDGTFALWTLNGFSVTSAGGIGNPGAGWTDLG